MGYDLSVVYIDYSLSAKSTAHELMKRLCALLDPSEERTYDKPFDWYATAIEYLYYQHEYNWNKIIDCRGCYYNYVVSAYILSYVFVWQMLGSTEPASLLFNGDDGSGMVQIRKKRGGIMIKLYHDELNTERTILIAQPLNDKIVSKICKEDISEYYDSFDCDNKVNVDIDAMNVNDIKIICSIIEKLFDE